MYIFSEQLGNRLEQGGQSKSAQLCYICAGSFEQLVNSWSDTTSLSSENLQELVELVAFLQKAVERQGRYVEVTGNLAELLVQYSSILAAQGRLSTALNYLGNSQAAEVSDLRDRLTVSLRQKQTRAASVPAQPRTRQNSAVFNSYANQFNTGLPTAAAPAGQPWQQQASQQVFAAPAKPFSPTPVPAGVPPSQPPRPPSVGM